MNADSTSPVALVTGSGAPRVGQRVARVLADNGYRIVVHAYRSVDSAHRFVSELTAGGTDARLVTGDVTCEKSILTMRNQTLEAFGRCDVLVHAAASWDKTPLEQCDAAALRANLDNHAVSAFLLCRYFGESMQAQAEGGSITLLGDWSIDRPYSDFAAYLIGKGSLPTLVRTMAVELGRRNGRVRVNAVMPGTILLGDDFPADKRQQLADLTLAGRIGCPEDVAAAVLFFASCSFVTGVCLPVDGGRHCYSGPNLDVIAHPEA